MNNPDSTTVPVRDGRLPPYRPERAPSWKNALVAAVFGAAFGAATGWGWWNTSHDPVAGTVTDPSCQPSADRTVMCAVRFTDERTGRTRTVLYEPVTVPDVSVPDRLWVENPDSMIAVRDEPSPARDVMFTAVGTAAFAAGVRILIRSR